MKAAEVALARVDEAEQYQAAYAMQVRKRELDLADCPCLDHYRKVTEAKAHLGAAKRHAIVAVRAAGLTQRKRKAA